MAFNGSGTFVRVHDWTTDKTNSVPVTASRMDAEQDGIATGLSTCITKDGQTTVTADLPMATFKHTGVGSASARTDYGVVSQIQDGSYNFATTGGSSNAYTLTLSPAITAYAAGAVYAVKWSFSNTGAATMAVSGLSAIAVEINSAAVISGQLASGACALIQIKDASGTKTAQVIQTFNPAVPGAIGGTTPSTINTTALSIKGQKVQSFELAIRNNAGTIEHRGYNNVDSETSLGNFADKWLNASGTYTTTPTGTDSSTAMANGGKVGSANTHSFIFDTAAQAAGDFIGHAEIAYNSTGTTINAICQFSSRDVNSATVRRLEILLNDDATGAAFAINTTNITNGNLIRIRFTGYLA